MQSSNIRLQSHPNTAFLKTISTTFLLTTFLMISSCSSQRQISSTKSVDPGTPIVQESQIKLIDPDRPSVAPDKHFSQSVQVVLTVNRDFLLNQEFLYGADLQYSSAFDSSMELYTQSMALGHIPARFRIVGDELQLIADNRRSYPSDVNHPELLLSRFKIFSQTEATSALGDQPAKPATLRISGANSSIILTNFFQGVTAGSSAAEHLKDLWIRSFDFVAKGNYLLQQTSVVFDDGTIGEFMESIFPRSTLAPGTKFQLFAMNPDTPTGAPEGDSGGLLSRFRLLAGETIFEAETPVSYAEHFDLSQNAEGEAVTLDFYVTPNIPDEALQPVQLAVEGWNRYFLKMQGIQRPVMQFKGRLPEGIYLGDPRYNVINWDSRTVAGAAYETQATDPSTGKQSHTLIYMPAAWLKIGATYWDEGYSSDEIKAQVERSVKPRTPGTLKNAYSSRVSCVKDLREGTWVLSSGRLPADELADFPIQLLKQTLFHEVGHSLGLAHNFKGSLTFDRSKPGSLFSSSIMDYNDFELERQAFLAVDSLDGPLLEYDRQILSALYNQGLDISPTDPILPACNDAEADQEAGGVDPLCLRYDSERDPTLSIDTALHRIDDLSQVSRGDVNLVQAIHHVAQSLTQSEVIQSIQTQEQMNEFIKKSVHSLQSVLRFYFTAGKASLEKTVVVNVKSLLQFQDQVLPADYSEKEMRERAFKGINRSVELTQLPDHLNQALDQATDGVMRALSKTPFLKNLAKEDFEKFTQVIESNGKALSEVGPQFEADVTHGLPNLRKAIFTALKRRDEVPFYLGNMNLDDTDGSNGILSDYETGTLGILFDAVIDFNRTLEERTAAAESLVTYRGRMTSQNLISRARDQIKQQGKEANNNQERERSEALLKILKPALAHLL